MILSQVIASDYAWVADGEKLGIGVARWGVGNWTGARDRGCARSVWKTDLPVPPTWISGGAANRFWGGTGGAFLRNVTAAGSVGWLAATPR